MYCARHPTKLKIVARLASFLNSYLIRYLLIHLRVVLLKPGEVMTRPTTVIDGDGHICEPELVWTEYTSAKFRDDVLQIRTTNGKSDIYIENRRLPFGAGAGHSRALHNCAG